MKKQSCIIPFCFFGPHFLLKGIFHSSAPLLFLMEENSALKYVGSCCIWVHNEISCAGQDNTPSYCTLSVVSMGNGSLQNIGNCCHGNQTKTWHGCYCQCCIYELCSVSKLLQLLIRTKVLWLRPNDPFSMHCSKIRHLHCIICFCEDEIIEK